MMSFVRGVIFSAMLSGVASMVSRSISQKTGVAPASTIMFTIETQVIDGVMTSSPGPSFMIFIKRCMAAVADESATPNRLPVISQTPDSSAAFCGPFVIQPERSTSVTARISASLIAGLVKGRNSLRIFSSPYDRGLQRPVSFSFCFASRQSASSRAPPACSSGTPSRASTRSI